jgi:hypothetical protein
MKFFLIFLSLVFIGYFSTGQTINKADDILYRKKLPIDTSLLYKWPTVLDAPIISNNGQFLLYKIRWSENETVAIVQGINNEFTKELGNIKDASFTSDSKWLIYISPTDSLTLFSLQQGRVNKKLYSNNFKLVSHGNKNLIVCLDKGPQHMLIVKDVMENSEDEYPNVLNYWINETGNWLVYEKQVENKTEHELNLVDLVSKAHYTIWVGYNLSKLIIDKKELAFLTTDSLDRTNSEIWYFRSGMLKATKIPSGELHESDTDISFDGLYKFSKNKNILLIWLKYPAPKIPPPGFSSVDIWSYQDIKLQSQQLATILPKRIMGALNLSTGNIIHLQKEGDVIGLNDILDSNYIYSSFREGDESEAFWNVNAKARSFLINVKDGSRKELRINFIPGSQIISPNRKYLIGLDETWKNIYCYELATGRIRNVTGKIPSSSVTMMSRSSFDRPRYKGFRGLRFAAWGTEENMLVYDDYDIWNVDLTGKKLPINITSFYGRNNSIVLRLIENFENSELPMNGSLVLSGFDPANKENGFFILEPGTHGKIKILTVSNKLYYYPDDFLGFKPVKARDTTIYIISRQSCEESPNLFWTTDFKTFNALTNVFPEKEYNWMSSELVTFTTLDGKREKAVIFKPGNFDPKLKYPLIMHFYEQMTNQLNAFHYPFTSYSHLDIPWFVSHGYVVCTPDIHYKLGEPGVSAYNSVVAATRFLCQFPWIDKTRLGIQGHSFGGYETNYIISHTNIYTAAVSSCGPSDFISLYGDISFNGKSRQFWLEDWQFRMGCNLWDNEPAYIRNSPIFNLMNITTPVLTVANKKDQNVPFSQGLELFTGLRRLGKKAWMLQYDNQSHGVNPTGKDYEDYFIRVNQFFDFYLKGKPAPVWMTRTIPASEKGFDNGLEFDNEIKFPRASKLVSPKY